MSTIDSHGKIHFRTEPPAGASVDEARDALLVAICQATLASTLLTGRTPDGRALPTARDRVRNARDHLDVALRALTLP